VSSFLPPGHDWFSGYPSKYQTQFFGEWWYLDYICSCGGGKNRID